VSQQAGRLANDVVVVTGAASGIGHGAVMACLREGAVVVGLDRDEAGLAALRAGVDAEGLLVDTALVDVTAASDITAAIDRVLSDHDRIDVLVNAAGISTMAPVVELTEQDWDQTFDVNTKGVFLMTRAVLPFMIQARSGSIVNIASAAGKRGSRTLSHYSASKFAVIGFTQSVALEVASVGVRANSVCPGLITTPMQDREVAWEAGLRGTSEQAVLDRYTAAVPMGRLGTPDDVARVVVFLASDESQYVTGESVDVGGGYAIS
jgi:meso-butanediol dehydrogenase / (S,S)-butanediol dehydrogenase / diacetyl reductase